MSDPVPFSLSDIITKVRRITARPNSNQISDLEILRYINTFYIYDMPEHMKMESLRYNYQFLTKANQAVYDFPVDLYLTVMPPVFIAGYQSCMTQSRENFFRINPQLNYLQSQVYTGNGTVGPYTGQFLTNTPIMPGFKPNPPGAYSTTPIQARYLNWNVLVSGTDASGNSVSLVDDGQGNLVDVDDTATPPSSPTVRGSVDYSTGAISINSTGFTSAIATGSPISVQYIPYVASRPQTAMFFQDQIILYPVPDQAYTVSFETYKYPLPFNTDASQGAVVTNPQLREWWQLLAYGAADKIFADNADFENMQKFRPLLDEQMKLCMRRSIVQQTSERTATVYTEQSGFGQYPFGNLFGGM
jgi:hypothetical protein